MKVELRYSLEITPEEQAGFVRNIPLLVETISNVIEECQAALAKEEYPYSSKGDVSNN